MYSSTSNFRTEIKVVCLVLLVLLGYEFIIRTQEEALSLDVKHIRQIPAISSSLVRSEGLRVLFLGNSLTRNGVDAAVLEKELRAQGVGPLHIERVFPDESTISDWYYIFKDKFVDAGHLPNVLIVSFAEAHLQDNQAIKPDRLAGYFTSADDIPEIFANDVRDFDSRSDFLLSALSSSFANRTRVRTRLLDLLIPYYRDSAPRLNRTLQTTKSGKAENVQHTYHRLERLMAMAQKHGVRIIFVAMPQREKVYPVDPQLRNIIEASEMTFIDCRTVEGLERENYIDEMHLNSNGGAIYSRYLARQLAHVFRHAPGADSSYSADAER